MSKSTTSSIQIEAAYDKVFDFLADVENMPRWTVFAQSVEKNGGRHHAQTPEGRAELWIEDDRSSGKIDFLWRLEGQDQDQKAPSRLERHDDGLVYHFTVYEPPNAPEGTLDQLTEIVREELSTLKEIAERELR